MPESWKDQAWKFRGILQKNPALMSKLPPFNLENLMSAVHLHIEFDDEMLSRSFWKKRRDGTLTKDD